MMARSLLGNVTLFAVIISCVFCNQQHFLKMRRTIASIGLGSSFFGLSSQPSFAINTDASTSAAANVMRVSYSLKLIDKQITTVGDVRQVVTQIDKLMQNYKLKDNLQLSLDLIKEDRKRDEARSHGMAAFEDLSLVKEYYSDEIDNMSGKKIIPQEVLKFAAGASVAAQKELDQVGNIQLKVSSRQLSVFFPFLFSYFCHSCLPLLYISPFLVSLPPSSKGIFSLPKCYHGSSKSANS